MSAELTALRDALLTLPSSGPTGFEGLLAKVFAKILGVPFRLAKSGSQFGVDGKTSDAAFPVAFEAKRYRDDVPSTEVLNKIGALAIREDPVELWVLGTTGIVASQVADDLETLAGIHGFATLILDWQPDAPRLAAVLAEACSEVCEFLSKNVPTAGLVAKAIDELQILSESKELSNIADLALCQMRTASVATPMARDANRRWLVETLSNRIRAKSRLGQVLTPLDKRGSLILTRGDLLDTLQAVLQGSPQARLVAVLGDEGNGKSWLAIQACIELPTAPLVVMFSPEEFVTIPEGVNWDVIIAQKLLIQTEESITEESKARWRRRFERWRNAEAAASSPRLLVLVDGLNQRPAVTWGRHIDSLVSHTYELGGCTVVTSRSEYFQRHVEPRLLSPVKTVVVRPWSVSERDQVLTGKGVEGAKLHPAVASSLLNPRLLGIALTLLDADTLENLEALNVTWLLFEHLRMLDRERSDGHSATDFAGMLQDHAKDILTRVRSEVIEDLTVFNNLEPAAEGRFFQWMAGEPHRYTLREQGLTYALGLAIIEELRAAVRNDKDVQEALQIVLAPIAALDQTADATFAALTIACLDHRISAPIGVALLVGFAQLQNPDDELAASLTELARHRVCAFCEACEVLWMEPTPAPNADWLEASLQAIKRRPEVWGDIQPFIEKWLRYWWPDIRVDYKVSHAQGSPGDARRDAEAERDQRINSLNEVERAYLSQLIRQEASPYRLMQLALQICAGMPLESLVGSLSCGSFSMALAPSPFSPHDEFSSLIRFNRRDWPVVRDQLIVHAARLASPGTSASGQWAAVTLLRATGSFVDSTAAISLVAELTKDREPFTSWRLVESYCATDPCDPESDHPDNIDDTALKYAQLDISKLRVFMGLTDQDHFVDSALPGLARFSPNVAVGKHREFLTALPDRRGLPLRQATWAALDDAVLCDDKLAIRLLALSTSLTHDHADIDDASVAHVQQALLLAAFPHLSPQEQFVALDEVLDPNRIWLELLRLAKDGSPSQLIDAVRSRSPFDIRVAVPLMLAGKMGATHVPSIADVFPELLSSPHPLVRFAALQFAKVTSDPETLRAVVRSGWTAKDVSRSSREYIIGSDALIEAARSGVVTAHEIFSRIAPETLGYACTRLDDASVEQLATMLDASVRATSKCEVTIPPVKIVLSITRTSTATETQYSLKEVNSEPASLEEQLKRLSESESEFASKQKRLQETYDAFKKQLTPQMSAVVLKAFRLKEIQSILRVAPGLIQTWIDLLRGATESGQWALRNFGIHLACALTHCDKSSEGAELLNLLLRQSSFVREQYTLAGFPLESVALWQAGDSVEVTQLQFARLDACGNDQQIALEAAAAIYVGKVDILRAYVHKRISSPLPIDLARAITVAGFSNDASLASDLTANFHGDEGLLATAARSSQYAMDRYRWSKHWFNKMLAASTVEAFWTASVLFLKVVDARFDAEHRNMPVGSEVFNMWWWSVERRLKRRFGKWADKRQKTLFGSKVPDSIFLPQVPYHH